MNLRARTDPEVLIFNLPGGGGGSRKKDLDRQWKLEGVRALILMVI